MPRARLALFTGPEIVQLLGDLGITHVVWVPDTALGPWEAALDSAPRMCLIRVCREGEAWPLAAGLHLGGKSPLVVMQTTGLFESGDALRNVLFDLKLPIYSLIGVRNWLNSESKDTARTFAEPILRAWGLDRVWLERPADKPKLAEHYRRCRAAGIPGMALLAEGGP
jgi:sulfopyruvate decarboxylase TPP-binding subunit